MSSERKKDPNPPRLPEWIIQRLAWAEDRFSIQENLREEYMSIIATRGTRSANLWYWRHMIRSIFPFVKFSIYWWFVMFENYLKIVLRSIKKYKGYSFYQDYPEVEISLRMQTFSRGVEVRRDEKIFNEYRVASSDPEFFQMFSFPIISGEVETVLKEPNSVVISSSTAQKYFGHMDPVGQVLTI